MDKVTWWEKRINDKGTKNNYSGKGEVAENIQENQAET